MNDNATSCSLEHMVTIATAHQSLEQMVDNPWAIEYLLITQRVAPSNIPKKTCQSHWVKPDMIEQIT